MKLAGSLTRKPFADGRFFIAELTTAAKIDLPVKNGRLMIMQKQFKQKVMII